MSQDIIVSPGVIVDILPADEARRVIQAWLDVFARKRLGCRIKDYKWHLFSAEVYEAEEGDQAIRAYKSHTAEKYLVIDNDETIVFTTDQRPDKVGLDDCYVCPPNMAWTMAFTHEEGWLGPYFARHPEYEKLQEQHLAYVEKVKQIEHAMKMGWC
mgnify:CR=1 FL=1